MIRKFQLLALSSLCLLVLLAVSVSQAQITPSQDVYANNADPTTNFGANGLLDVDGASQITYIRFNLASVPSGVHVSQATLKLYVNAVTIAGSFNVDYVTGTGTTAFLPLWTNGTGALGNSILFQSGTGATAKVGINTTVPAVTLDVNGSENVRGTFSLLALGAATATAGKNSQPQDFITSVFNSSTSTAVLQKFQWQETVLCRA
jgi:hypothetical protein